MKRVAVLSVLALIATSSLAQENRPLRETSATVDESLSSFQRGIQGECNNLDAAKIDELRMSGQRTQAHLLKGVRRSACECIPARIEELKSSLNQKELKEVVNESVFKEKFLRPKVMVMCLTEQLRAVYGEGCSEAFSTPQKDGAAFCSCMSQALNGYKKAEMTKLILEQSYFTDRADEARSQGASLPEKTVMLKQFESVQKKCASR